MGEEILIIGNYDDIRGHMFRLRPDYNSRDIEMYQDGEPAFVEDVVTRDMFFEQRNHVATSVNENRAVTSYVNGRSVGTDVLVNDSTTNNFYDFGSKGDDDSRQDYGGILDQLCCIRMPCQNNKFVRYIELDCSSVSDMSHR